MEVSSGGNRKRERGARAVVRLGPQVSLMFLNDGAAHREPDPHALGLRRVERIEQLVDVLNREPDTSVPNGDADAIVPVARSVDQQLPGTITNRSHRVQSVAEQVQNHLLELSAVTGDHRKVVS